MEKKAVASPQQLFDRNTAVPPRTSIMLPRTAQIQNVAAKLFFFYPVTIA